MATSLKLKRRRGLFPESPGAESAGWAVAAAIVSAPCPDRAVMRPLTCAHHSAALLGSVPDNRRMAKKEPNRLQLFKKKMKPTTIMKERATSIHNAFASALALVGEYNEEVLNEALMKLGQGDPAIPLMCVYCGDPAKAADHLNGLVLEKRYSGNGQVIGNLVPCCSPCNSSKGNRAWRVWCNSETFLQRRPTFSKEQEARLADYESLSPPTVGHAELVERYPDQMTEYDELKEECLQAMRKADLIAKEIQRLEKKRLCGQGLIDPDETQ
jgi:5-methylcytosine-specific restriction endonuclease McrA